MKKISNKKPVSVKSSKKHQRKGGWVRGHWRKKSKLLKNKAYNRSKPTKKKKANSKDRKSKKTVQTRIAKPRKGPARRSIQKK